MLHQHVAAALGVVCEHAQTAFSIRGFERSPIRNLELIDVEIRRAGRVGVIEHVEELVLDSVAINDEPFAASPV